MKCMEEERPVGLIRADENVSWNGVAIGGRFFCTNHNIKPAHHQHLCGPFAIKSWSGLWDSNPRHQPWQGCALPLSYIRLERLEPYGVRVPRVYKVFLPWQDFFREKSCFADMCALLPAYGAGEVRILPCGVCRSVPCS